MRWVAAWCSAQSDVNPRSGQKALQENVITGWKSVGPIQPEREICKEDARKGFLELMTNKTATIQDKWTNYSRVYISVFWVKFLLFYNWWWYWGQNQALIPEFSLKRVLTAQLLGWEWNTGRWQQITRPISTPKTASCANISSMSRRKAKPSHCWPLGSDRCLLSILNEDSSMVKPD